MNIDKIKRVARGNPGALTLAMQLPEPLLDTCLQRGITAERLWLCFKYLGDQTVPRLIENIEAADIGARLAALGYAPEVQP